jgi:diacylglycerol O-acyltransferase / trehalose O-mycolyltransferase
MRGLRSFVVGVVVVVVFAMLELAGAASAAGISRPAGPAWHAPDGAYVVARQQTGPRIVDLTVWSPALGRTAIVHLLTPTGWGERRHGQRWPVLYLLHGCCDTPDSWTRETDVEDIPALRRVLVVTPEGGDVGWYTDWWNHGAGGPPRWETFHLSEVRPLLEHGYGAGHRRVIAGLSMGGAGAMTYAARHPGMFRAAASYSGVVHPLMDPYGLLGAFSDFGASDPYAIWGDPVAQRAIWTAHDPVSLAPRLRGIPLFLSVGNGTAGPFDPPGTTDDGEAWIQQMNLDFAARLAQLRIPVTTDFYGPGTHSWPYWERELHRSLPLLLDALCRGHRDGRGDWRTAAAAAA